MAVRRTLLSGLLSLTLPVLLSCGESTDLDLDSSFRVTGTIRNNTQTNVPADARLVVAWVVTSGPDYTYVFGEGEVHAAGGTFELVMREPPPAPALNGGALGVGVIVATTDLSVSIGDDLKEVPQEDIVGAAGSYGVIYVSDHAAATAAWPWVADFEPGYAVGIGEAVPGSFDHFAPISASDVVLVIDHPDNIEFVNWS